MRPDKIYLSLALLIILTTVSWITSCTHKANFTDIPSICFTGDVLPIFLTNCAISGCHNGDGRRESRLALNNYSDIRRSIVPGNSAASRSYQAIIAKMGENMMPPRHPLSIESRTKIRLWIEQGADSTACPEITGPARGVDTYVARACFSRDILPVLTIKTVQAGNAGSSKLFQVINITSGENKMPPSGQIPKGGSFLTCRIRQFEIWVKNGSLNI